MARWNSDFVDAPMGTAPSIQRGILQVRCPMCGADPDAHVQHAMIAPATAGITPGPVPGAADGSGAPLYLNVYSYLATCTRCRGAIVVQTAYGEDPKGRRAFKSRCERVFPLATTAFATGDIESKAVPEAVIECLRQAELAQAAGAPYGAGLLLRRACQYICRERGVPDQNDKGRNIGLGEQIKQLVGLTGISQQHAEMAAHVKIIGDELAHPETHQPSVITEDDVDMARRFLEQLVTAVYITPAQLQALSASLQNRGVNRR